MTKENRKLKVYAKFAKSFKTASLNPEIRLTGKWVKEWGFKCGSEITVKKLENGIILINEGANNLPTIYL